VAGLGGTVLVPPRDTPTGRVMTLADPGGAVLTLLTSRPTSR
jgi:predicted enzyme related to lactoylglutathione lyase